MNVVYVQALAVFGMFGAMLIAWPQIVAHWF